MTHIAVDLDDVVLDFCGGISHAVETEYGVTVPVIDRWELNEILDPILGESWWKWMRARDWLWPNFPAIPGAIGALRILRKSGHYLECVTSKPEWAEFAVWKWLGKWRPPFNRVTIVSPENISRKSEATEASVLIDDKPANCVEWADAGRLAFLFDRTHNQEMLTRPWPEDMPLDSGVYRVLSWRHILHLNAEGLL